MRKEEFKKLVLIRYAVEQACDSLDRAVNLTGGLTRDKPTTELCNILNDALRKVDIAEVEARKIINKLIDSEVDYL